MICASCNSALLTGKKVKLKLILISNYMSKTNSKQCIIILIKVKQTEILGFHIIQFQHLKTLVFDLREILPVNAQFR